jgi:NADH dehydrogenase [ubiquinone] 1 alpha subcomplex assembly factor 3
MTARLARHLPPFSATASTLRFAQPILSRPQYATPASPRLLHTSPSLRASGGLTNLFDADDQGARPRIQVNKLNDEGFHLSDGLVIPGGVIFVENRAFLWDVDPVGVDELSGRGKWSEDGWSKERFAVFEMVVPRPGENACGALLSDG